MKTLSGKPASVAIDAAESLKPLSALAIRLSTECQKPEPCLNTAIELIEYDPGMSARILAMANSPLYGYTRQIDTIPRAAIVLGMRTISNLAISFSAGDVFRADGEHAVERQKILDHSLGCAVICRILARETRCADPSAAFLSGIMHDIGKLALLERDGESYATHCFHNSGSLRLETEQEKFGTNHAEIGKQYISKMRLPPQLGLAVSSHHQPDPTHTDLNGVVAVANLLTKTWLEGQRGIEIDPGPFASHEQEAVESFEAFRCNFRG